VNVRPPSEFSIATTHGRTIRANLQFAVGGGRSFLTHQHVPYPFHLTRPFYLDRERPDCATVYLQSVSGGLYRADDLDITISTAEGAAAHVTTQAATVVHDTQSDPVRQRVSLRVSPGSLLVYTPDPIVLFPSADIVSETTIEIAADAHAILCEGQTWFDPLAQDRDFGIVETSVLVRGLDGTLLAADRSILPGRALKQRYSPLMGYRAVGNAFLLGEMSAGLDPSDVERDLHALGCLSGISRLPGANGLIVRLLGPDGGTLARGLGLVFRAGFRAMTGLDPAPRRK
jgi:urease accessory protein